MKYKKILKDYKILEREVREKLTSLTYQQIMLLGYNESHAKKLKSGEKPAHGRGGFKSIIELAIKLKI